MPVLGYGQVSSIAPNAIARGYEGIVQNLRQTGQEIAANVQRVQTNKQVTALGQEMATIDPYSPQFPQQMLAVATKYPMALADQRGQALMGVLGIAHKDYLAQKADERNFGQQKEILKLQNTLRGPTMYNTPGGLYNPELSTEGGVGGIVPGTAPTPKVAAPPRPVVIPGVGGFDPITYDPIPGMQIPEKVAPGEKPMTGDQVAKAKLAQVNAQGTQINRVIQGLNSEYQNLTTELKNTEDENRKNYINGRLGAIWNEIDLNRNALKALSDEAAKVEIQAATGAPTLGGLNPIQAAPVPMVPDAAAPSVLPTPAQLPVPQTPKNSGPNWKKFLTPP